MTEENKQTDEQATAATAAPAEPTADVTAETTAAEPTAETPQTETATEAAPAEPIQEQTPEEKTAVYTNIVPGMTVRVHQKIRELNAKGEEKERIQVYEGIIISKRHGSEIGATITVRKISHGIGVEKIFPLNSPNVANIEPVKQARVRRSKLYFLRSWKGRLKEVFLNK
ncbi:50S ribosomal protein L19 [Candidatus Falkowbacteria bacterium]|nr:50S ribosomal protein L19 [Candidatus Falkowbacteria bacterium]